MGVSCFVVAAEYSTTDCVEHRLYGPSMHSMFSPGSHPSFQLDARLAEHGPIPQVLNDIFDGFLSQTFWTAYSASIDADFANFGILEREATAWGGAR